MVFVWGNGISGFSGYSGRGATGIMEKNGVNMGRERGRNGMDGEGEEG